MRALRRALPIGARFIFAVIAIAAASTVVSTNAAAGNPSRATTLAQEKKKPSRKPKPQTAPASTSTSTTRSPTPTTSRPSSSTAPAAHDEIDLVDVARKPDERGSDGSVVSSGGICDIDPSACPKRLDLNLVKPIPTPPSERATSTAAPPPPLPLPPPLPVAPPVAETEWQMATALANAKLTQGAVRILATIAQNPQHPHHRDALVRLALLSREMPDGSELERWFGAATLPTIATLPNDPGSNQGAPRSAAMYLLGKHRYLLGNYDEAIAALTTVDDKDPLKARALLYAAAANVRLHKSTPAIQSLQRALAILDTAAPSYDRAYLRELALVSIARIYFAASFRMDENNTPSVDALKLSAAVLHFERVDTGSSLWPEVAHEMAWLFLMAGDYARADALARLLSAGALDGRHAIAARVLRGLMAFSNCRYDEVEQFVISVMKVGAPIQVQLATTITRTKAGGDDAFFALLVAFRDNRTNVDPAVAAVLGRTLVDRGIARRMAYLGRIDAEAAMVAKTGALFPGTSAGIQARAAIDTERARVVRALSLATRNYLERERDEIEDAHMQTQRMLIDTTAAKRNQLDAAIGHSQVTVLESRMNIMRPSEAQLDPFERYLPDHVRRYPTRIFYSETGIFSKCGR